MSKKAKGEVKRLLLVIGELQNSIGMAQNLHYNDRSPTSFTEAQEILKKAFDLCVKTTSDYDPCDT